MYQVLKIKLLPLLQNQPKKIVELSANKEVRDLPRSFI